MLILGLVLMLIGFVLAVPVLWTLGIILAVIGVILWIVGSLGHGVAGRRWYY
jgi:hypothetical protein